MGRDLTPTGDATLTADRTDAGTHAGAEARPREPFLRRLGRALRRLIARNRAIDLGYRIVLGTIGGVLVAGGLVLVPLPGPGWLVVFAGLAVLGTEFGWARRAGERLKRALARFWAWWRARRAHDAAAS